MSFFVSVDNSGSYHYFNIICLKQGEQVRTLSLVKIKCDTITFCENVWSVVLKVWFTMVVAEEESLLLVCSKMIAMIAR